MELQSSLDHDHITSLVLGPLVQKWLIKSMFAFTEIRFQHEQTEKNVGSEWKKINKIDRKNILPWKSWKNFWVEDYGHASVGILETTNFFLSA